LYGIKITILLIAFTFNCGKLNKYT